MPTVTPHNVCGLLVALHVYEATRHDAAMREAHRRAWQEPKYLDLYDSQATSLEE